MPFLPARFPARLAIGVSIAALAVIVGTEDLSSQRPFGSRRTVMLDGREVADGEVIVTYRQNIGEFERQISV